MLATSSRIRCATGVVALLVALGGCESNPERSAADLKAMEPKALAAANERATTDLGCGAITTELLSSEGATGSAYDLKRMVYRVQATGCGLRTVYSVACSVNTVCSAISEGGVVERVKQ